MGSRFITALLVAALTLPLGGCWKEQQQAMAACQAQIPYQGKFPAVTNVVTPIVTCMDKAGYVRDYEGQYCVGRAVPRRDAYCYRPKGFFAALGHRLEMTYRGGPTPPGNPPS
jgi:hypothetical protein